MTTLPDLEQEVINILRNLEINIDNQSTCDCRNCIARRQIDLSKVQLLKGPYECPICYEFVAGIYKMNCNHTICVNCAKKWKKECVDNYTVVTCPLCRAEDVLFGTIKTSRRKRKTSRKNRKNKRKLSLKKNKY